MLKRGKVVLFSPFYVGPIFGPPAALLHLAAPLREAGYEVRIIDGKITPNHLDEIEREIEDALCLGISYLTGPMIRGAIAASELAKRLRPKLPVIHGGWHPSLVSEQTLREPYVDVVVRHQGEKTLLEVAGRLQSGEELDGVAGCWFKREGEFVKNPDRPVERLEDLPSPAYDMVDFDQYEEAGGGRVLPYATSVGCPYECSYCTDTVFYSRRFNALSPERVVGELAGLVKEHRVDRVALLDSNFLVNTKRAVAIAQGIVDAGVRFSWTFQASTDFLCRLSDEDVRLLARSGVNHIGFGTESADEDVLAVMNKRHQTIPDIHETARKTQQAGIRVTFNLIFGYPGETEAARRETFRVMGEIAQRYDNVGFSPNILTPYPAIPLWPELERLGVRQPQSLNEWSDFALSHNVLPWLQDSMQEQVARSMLLLSLLRKVTKRAATQSRFQALGWGWLRQSLCWRVKTQMLRWPVELWLYQLRSRLVMRRSLLTGQDLGYTIDHAH